MTEALKLTAQEMWTSALHEYQHGKISKYTLGEISQRLFFLENTRTTEMNKCKVLGCEPPAFMKCDCEVCANTRTAEAAEPVAWFHECADVDISKIKPSHPNTEARELLRDFVDAVNDYSPIPESVLAVLTHAKAYLKGE